MTQKWEHCTSAVPKRADNTVEIDEKFDWYGQKGWELVSVDNGIAYFKRPANKEVDTNVYAFGPDGRMVIIGRIDSSQKPLKDPEDESLGPYPHVSKGTYSE